jgi:hypothetical protein
MSRRAWFAFAGMSAIWGIPYLFIKIAVRGGMTPYPLAWARVTLAAVVLLALAARAGTLGSLRGRWRWLAAYAVAEVTIPFPMIAIGHWRDPRRGRRLRDRADEHPVARLPPGIGRRRDPKGLKHPVSLADESLQAG